jgi:hypothetical protein
MNNELREAAERQAMQAGPKTIEAFFQLEEDALLLARAYLAEHTPTSDGPPMSDRPDVCKCGHPSRVHVDGRCDGTYRGTTHGPGLCECKAFEAQHTPTPDGPPAAAPERKAGERFIAQRADSRWNVYEWPTDGGKAVGIAFDLSREDAELLAHAPARLRAMEAALKECKSLMDEASQMSPCKPGCGCCAIIIRERTECLANIRAALAGGRLLSGG